MAAKETHDRQLRLGIVGLGRAFSLMLPTFLADSRVELVAACDPRAEARKRFSAEFQAPACEGIESLARDPSVDAIYIASPHQFHAAHTRIAAAHGKHVLVEKPMALGVDEARELGDIARREGRILAVVHNFQFARSTLRLRKLMADGRLGEVQALWGSQLSNPRRRLPEWYESLPLGLFYDESPHFFYLVRALLGANPEIEVVHVVGGKDGRNTPAAITLLMRAGSIPAQISMNFVAPVSEWHLTVIGSRALAVLDVFRDVLVVTRNDREHLGRHILRTTADVMTSHLSGVARSGALNVMGKLAYGNDVVIARFVEACRTRVPPKDIAADDGLEVVKLQHEVLDRANLVAD